MNKKGFTLIELLAVILILGIIMLIAIPVVNNTIKEARRGAFETSVQTIEKGVRTACKMEQMRNESGVISYTFHDGNIIKNEGTIEDFDVKGELPDSGTINTNINCEVEIIDICKGNFCADKNFEDEKINITNSGNFSNNSNKKDNVIDYETPSGEKFKCTTKGMIDPIKTVYFNPEKGTTCTSKEYDSNLTTYSNGKTINPTGLTTGCLKWYVYNINSNDTVDMILDHNTTPLSTSVKWNSNGIAKNGPKEVLDELKKETDIWTGVPSRNDSYFYNSGVVNYTISYAGYRARLISAGEIAKITGNTSFDEETSKIEDNFILDYCGNEFYETIYNKVLSEEGTSQADAMLTDYYSKNNSKYYWLFDYTLGCNKYGCKNSEKTGVSGYWTSTAIAGSTEAKYATRVWDVTKNGYLNSIHIASSTGGMGIRPVITISKSLIG